MIGMWDKCWRLLCDVIRNGDKEGKLGTDCDLAGQSEDANFGAEQTGKEAEAQAHGDVLKSLLLRHTAGISNKEIPGLSKA